MENHDLPLHLCHANNFSIFINKFHAFFHCIALAFLVYYRASFLFQETRPAPIIPWLLVFASELLLSFIWLIGRAYHWNPVYRTAFPERLPDDDKLPAIDVFICTADPEKEPTFEVMNTVLSAMALDYPPEKLHVYLSDDGGSPKTLHGMREVYKFAKWWLPFCRSYGIKTRCPLIYFSAPEYQDGSNYVDRDRFMADKLKIKEKYDMFKECLKSSKEDGEYWGNKRDHPSIIELRASGVISNSPYILGLDCDMYCVDPGSARQAMCFHLDRKITASLAYVQFPQKFHNVGEHDIYDGQLRSAFGMTWYGMDGLTGPVLSGTGYYLKRESLYGHFAREGADLLELKNSFGSSNLFVKSIRQNIVDGGNLSSTLLQEAKVLASSTYESNTEWGEKVGFLYESVAEDFFTGFILHCKGWKSTYLTPSRPQFLGSSTTNLNDLLIQGIRWSSGLIQVGVSRFCPLTYGSLRMSFLQSLCYGELALFPLFYCLPLWCFATVPQLCLLNGISLYPEVSSPFFMIFSFIFLSALLKHLQEVLSTGGSIETWRNEQRLWMIKSVTSHLYGSLDAIMKTLGLRQASFQPTNKVLDEEQAKIYRMGRVGDSVLRRNPRRQVNARETRAQTKNEEFVEDLEVKCEVVKNEGIKTLQEMPPESGLLQVEGNGNLKLEQVASGGDVEGENSEMKCEELRSEEVVGGRDVEDTVEIEVNRDGTESSNKAEDNVVNRDVKERGGDQVEERVEIDVNRDVGENSNTAGVKVGSGVQENVPDLEKMTLGEYMEAYLPKQITEATEEMIEGMRRKAERLHEYTRQHKMEKGKL
ncbi:hypothetical protein LWI29_037198 [Acer saccharum]|uniref:Cellulose synthase-like protein G2 n=1 Tax=Acer saccharum TaxID=4024 RepID=A0AA39TPS0_ACESA|nr:hypothetical protein LWI29_037198 [Acer saccharum]